MGLVFDDAEFDGQLQRAISKAYERCSDIGECLATARRIEQSDYDSWYDQWSATAEKTQQAAETLKAAGHAMSAREAYLRACEYYRSAYFFRRSDLEDPKLLAASKGVLQGCGHALRAPLRGRGDTVRWDYPLGLLP